MDYTTGIPAPAIFRKWAAVSAIAGALERRAWIQTAGGILFPNMFILMISNPGVGKDQAINPMRDIWAASGKFNLAPISMTGKGLLDQLADSSSQKQIIDKTKNQWINYHSLLIAVPELGVILPSHDLGFLSILNELFNCWPLFEERIRSRKEILRIERPHIHLISGTQPKYMGALLPDEAYGMGFTARIIMVYAGEPVKIELFKERPTDQALRERLVSDMKIIGEMSGPFNCTAEAVHAIEAWHLHGSEKDKPQHSKLQHYATRRILHILKLCMVFSVSRRDDLIIELEDFEQSLALLQEAEEAMPEIFKEISSGGQASEIEEAFLFVMRLSAGGTKPVSEHKLTQFLTSRVPANQIQYIITTMLRSNIIAEVNDGTTLNLPGRIRLFKPIGLGAIE